MRSQGIFQTAFATLMTAGNVLAYNFSSTVPSWCGKPYMNTSPASEPGGEFQFPTPQADPMLYVTIEPQYSIFLENDEGSFIVNAVISHVFGQSYTNVSYDTPGSTTGSPFTTMDFEIYNEETGSLLVSNSVPVNSTGSLFGFSFSSFNPRLAPYAISIYGTSPDGQQSYTASTSIYVLPTRSSGSAVKIDNLFGGCITTNLDTYAGQGFNTINIVPDGGLPDQSYPTASLAQYWDRMDELNLFNIYDMRFAFMNASRISTQVELWKNRTTLLSYYTGDEPDGWQYPLNSTKLAYDQLKELDPYHPVSLVLNCQNFYYTEYSSGADIVFEDAYPVAINATWSVSWDTPCNLTYGDCGCDNCVGELEDVSNRLDDIQHYQANLEGQGSKPTWGVIQAFGEQDYWESIPSPAEVENMMMLAVNHNAKGISYWIYPSTAEVNVESGELGKVFQTEPGLGFLFGTNAIKGLQVAGEPLVDASAWIVGEKMMVGIASEEYVDFSSTVSITLPVAASAINETLFGDSSWTVSGNKLSKAGLKALEVDILVLNLSS
ncbi:hypothetical protein D0Z07_6822 [Hyphodiscus hymeniophilus]|uniref:Glycoside hydrolase subgroup catalytic core n=1 Tax=Hyphodiscus hymeniophilus TaxID=353542 RepID=A0A9P6VGG5_9HELO|nr:hypothetical protein D0Z07_6822 [Hyphodiscus hymeniophilus]